MAEPKKILIRMPNWVGDAVMATPLIVDLKNALPESQITLMCQGAINQLFLHEPLINGMIAFKKPSGFIHRVHQSQLIHDLRKGEFDIGILTTNSFSSAWWFYRGGIPRRIGFRDRGRSFLLTDPVSFPKNRESQHLIKTYKELLSPLGIPLSDTPTRLVVTEEEKNSALSLLKKEGFNSGKIVGINPGAAYGSAKCWLPERFRKLAEDLIKDKSTFVVFYGDASQRAMIDGITNDLGPQVINLSGKTTLRELMAFISLSNVFVSNDSGPLHMAYALKIPVVAIFGPTSEIISGPQGKSLTIHKHVECSPCFKRTCPIDHRCMTQIKTDEVYDAVKRLLNG